jgi:hypothetical protein
MKLLETAWDSYRLEIIPKNASGTQVWETKKAFYAGAGSLLGSILKVLGPDAEPTESDLLIMGGIQAELADFFTEASRAEPLKVVDGEDGGSAVKLSIPPETPFTREQLKALQDSPFKGPTTPYPTSETPPPAGPSAGVKE